MCRHSKDECLAVIGETTTPVTYHSLNTLPQNQGKKLICKLIKKSIATTSHGISKVLHCWPFVRGIYNWTMDSSYKTSNWVVCVDIMTSSYRPGRCDVPCSIWVLAELYKTCYDMHEYYTPVRGQHEELVDGNYIIDPGVAEAGPPFTVFCDFPYRTWLYVTGQIGC